MARFTTQSARSCGKGLHSPGESVLDVELSRAVAGYKRSVASRYEAFTPEDVEKLPEGKLWVSPKVDGEQWCLVLDEEEGAFLVNPRGRVLSGKIPALEEAAKVLEKVKSPTVIAGELFAVRKGGRPRHGDLANALSGDEKAEVDRVAFMAFDLVWGGDDEAQMPLDEYPERLAVLERLFEKGKRVKAVKTEMVAGAEAAMQLYETWVTSGKAEGLVVRSDGNRTMKVKPAITIDAAVIGYTERSEDDTQASSFLLALLREDGNYQLVGHCGNLGAPETRRELLKTVRDLKCASGFREANSKGALYQFIRPVHVAEVRITDIQAEKADGDIVPRIVLSYEEGEWVPKRFMPGVSLLHPRLVRLREDKECVYGDIPISQVFERVLLHDSGKTVEKVVLPASELLRREVYTKTTKGVTAVRKLLMWKTNKEIADTSYPAYVVHFTDYSPTRKDPLKRTVRLAPDEALAKSIADEMIAKEIKKGWALVED